MSRRVKAVAGFALALLVIGGFLTAVGPARVAAELSDARPLPLAAGAVALVGAFCCWSEALRRLLAGLGHDVGAARFRRAFMSGEFVKQVLPMGHSGGPVFVSYAVSRETEAPYEETLAAATVVEFVNVAASIVLATAGLGYFLLTRDGALEPILVALLVGLAIAVLALAGAAVLVYSRRALLERIVIRVAGALRATVGRLSARVRDALVRERVTGTFESYYASFDRALADRRRVVTVAGFSLLGWALFLVPLYTSFLALGSPISYAMAVFVVPVLSLVNVVPLPGGLGGFEIALAAVVVGLVGLGMPTAAAGVFLYRLSNYWLVVLMGGIASLSLSMRLADPPSVLPPERPEGN